jgi:hypothetical protein
MSRTARQVDLSGRVVVFESLKKRRRGIFRAVPVPPELLDALDMVHGIQCPSRLQMGHLCGQPEFLAPEGQDALDSRKQVAPSACFRADVEVDEECILIDWQRGIGRLDRVCG